MQARDTVRVQCICVHVTLSRIEPPQHLVFSHLLCRRDGCPSDVTTVPTSLIWWSCLCSSPVPLAPCLTRDSRALLHNCVTRPTSPLGPLPVMRVITSQTRASGSCVTLDYSRHSNAAVRT